MTTTAYLEQRKSQKRTNDLFRRILKQMKPPPDITLSQWADQYRMLSAEAASEAGHWRTSRAPYQRAIMDAITDINIRKVVVMSASQMGKTDAFILNPVGYYVHYDPAPIMIMEPTLQMSEDLSKDRLSTMIRDTQVVGEKIDDRSRTSGNTILHKVFPGGHVTLVGANSPASLASRPIRILLADELDRYPPTAGKEGDPLFLAEQRTKTFWNKKIIVVSTPTIKGASRIETEYQNSTMDVWTVPCPACGEYQELQWGKIVFDSKHFFEGNREVGMTCEHCGVLSSEVEWKAQMAKGRYLSQHPERETKGFLITGLASTFQNWDDIVQKFLEANAEAKNGNVEPLKSWTNTEMGQTWEDEGETIDEGDLLQRLEEYPSDVPEGVQFITCGVDVQADRFEFEFIGWGTGKESWGLGYNVIRGDLKQKEIWDELDGWLSTRFQKADGTILNIGCTCIDSGFHANEVYSFCKEREFRNIFAIKGVSGFDKPLINRPSTGNRVKAKLFSVGVDVGKSLVMDRLNVRYPGPGYCHFSNKEEHHYDDYYFRMLTAEKRVMTYKKGQAIYTWELRNNSWKRNEALDIRDYATAALEIANPPLGENQERARKVRVRRVRNNGVRR